MTNRPKPINPARVMAAGFMGLIILGSFLLSLPSAYISAEFSYADALFTAASAVCVTGLVVVDTGTFFSTFGQVVIMILIFCGSLGFMTMTTLIFVFLGRKITLRNRLVIKEALNQESISDLVPLVKTVILIAVFFILIGTMLLSIRFIPQFGHEQGLFFALFHAVSAFGNAGFDLFGRFESLTQFPADYLVNGTIMSLFIIGGLGFIVILDLNDYMYFRSRISLNSRFVLILTASLLMFGTVLILILEYNNPATMGSLSVGEKIFTALFTAATPRTAGFSVLETGSLGYPTFLIMLVMMFIGASPTSTGGGVKTTTFGILVITLISMIRGRHEPVVSMNRIPLSHIMKAISIISSAVLLVFIAAFCLSLFEDFEFSALLFEAFSAFGTVGLTRGITPDLNVSSKLVLIATMFGGRIGPLTLLVALSRQREGDVLRYPEEHLLIG